MSAAASLAKRIAASLGVHVTREAAANRFQAVDICLQQMKSMGYLPQVIVDGGANAGQFHRLVQPIFPDARYHLIEPQPSCSETLREIVRARPERIHFHPCAISSPGVSSVRMTGCGSTGAYVAKEDEPAEVEVPAATLDVLFREKLERADRTLLKLDLESHEYEALSGAIEILPVVEALLVEVAFFDINDWGRPIFANVFDFVRDAGFELYDIASLSSRPRDKRLCMGDIVFVRSGTPLVTDTCLK